MGILLRYVEFGNDCVSRTTIGFSDKQHLKQNVNLPPLMMMPAAADPIIQTANRRALSKKL